MSDDNPERHHGPELWTERQATEYLRLRWTGRDATRAALKAGVAGAPIRVRNALLYRADEVRAALDRTAHPCEIAARVDRPVFVARMAPREADPESSWRTWRGADVLAPRNEQVDAARAWWHLGDRLYALVRALASAKGMPFVVTCGGIVVLGAEIVGMDRELEAEGMAISRARRDQASSRQPYTRLASAFVLREPGPWFEGQYGRRWKTGAGGPFRVVGR